MLRWQRNAVHLVRQEGIARHDLVDWKAPFVRLFLPTLHAAVEPCEQHLDGAVLHAGFFQQRGNGDTAPARRPDSLEQPRLTDDVRLDVRSPLPAHSIVTATSTDWPRTQVVERQRLRPFHQAADVEPPCGRVDIRDVVVREEVVQADRREVPAQRLERYAVIPRCELELLEADPLGHEADRSAGTSSTNRARSRHVPRREEP